MKGVAYTGWKLGLPDRFWPLSLDNFFDDPDKIRELGLRLLEPDEVLISKVVKSSDEGGKWPGYRSSQLWQIDPGLAQRITGKILSCYFNLDFEEVSWNSCEMQFQLIPSLDKDKNNTKNKGWIHRDGIDPRFLHTQTKSDVELAGLIYLTPDIEPDTGTSLFDMRNPHMRKDKTLKDKQIETAKIRSEIHLGNPVNDKEAKEQWENHRSCFVEKLRFENIYNRLIAYDGKEWHGANNYYTSRNNRLTLIFFIGGIRANKWPLERVREIKIC